MEAMYSLKYFWVYLYLGVTCATSKSEYFFHDGSVRTGHKLFKLGSKLGI